MPNQLKRGTRTLEWVSAGDYLKGVRVRLPAHVVTGKRAGPTLYIQACQHGTEINGWAACREILERVRPEELRGTLIVVPVANPIALQARLHGYPDEAPNKNRVWPGDPQGPFLPHRMAAALWRRYIRHADTVIDFHCWGDMGLPMAWTQIGLPDLIRAFGTPYLMELRRNPNLRMLGLACQDHGIPCCALEMIPQNRIAPESVRLGVTGALNLLRFTGMLEGEMEYPPRRYVCAPGPEDVSLTVSTEGMWMPLAERGKPAKKGQVLGRVHDWLTLEVLEEIAAPWSGLVYSDRAPWDRPNTNLVEPGDAVATMRKLEAVLRPSDGPFPGAGR